MIYNLNQNESQLVRSLAKGNLLAFNTLYKEYSNRLYRFAVSYLKSEEEAEEVVQEVFTKIWEKKKDLKAEFSFKSFLFTIAFNCIRKHFRTKIQIAEYFRSIGTDDSDIMTSQKITYDSLHQYITELVEYLPARRREIFIKSRFEGLSIKKIAEELNIGHKTVENQLTEALRFIRTKINKEILSVALFYSLFVS